MAKRIALIVTLALCLVACGDGDVETEPTKSSAEDAAPPPSECIPSASTDKRCLEVFQHRGYEGFICPVGSNQTLVDIAVCSPLEAAPDGRGPEFCCYR
jgi:hypothetical protein